MGRLGFELLSLYPPLDGTLPACAATSALTLFPETATLHPSFCVWCLLPLRLSLGCQNLVCIVFHTQPDFTRTSCL